MEYKGLKYVPVSGSGYYTVKSGDTLWTIARNNGLTVDELKKLNNLSSNSLSIGQLLKVAKDTSNETETDNNKYYTVKSGDTLYGIARKYNLTVNELKNMNKLTNNTLQIGQKLIVGQNIADSNNIYIVKSGDTLYSIANKNGTTVDEIKKINNLASNNLSIGQEIILPTSTNYKIYTVVSGDTLYGIALKNGTDVNTIKNINNLTSNVLSIGQKLLLP